MTGESALPIQMNASALKPTQFTFEIDAIYIGIGLLVFSSPGGFPLLSARAHLALPENPLWPSRINASHL